MVKMFVPGSNLLNLALTVIHKQMVTYHQATGRSQNSIGQFVTTYTNSAMVGSFQPVDKKLYEAYGLDLQKTYATFYTSNNIIDIARDVSNDQITYNGQLYQCESNNDWFAQDGWKGVLCCMKTAGN
jgi:hypothetical protein